MNNWHLNPEEVRSYDGGSYNVSLRTNSRQPKTVSPSSIELYLVHEPTNIEVKGIIPDGNYSKKELLTLKQSLYNSLFLALEEKVKAFLNAKEST